MTKIVTAAAAAALTLAAASAALAQPMPNMPNAMRAPMAPMTRVSVVERVQMAFARLDTNRDGALTPAEVQAGTDQMRAMMRERGEQNGGQQRQGRWQQRGQRTDPGAASDPTQQANRGGDAFDSIDADRNGIITRDEFARAHAPGGVMQGHDMGEGMGGDRHMGGNHRMGGDHRMGGEHQMGGQMGGHIGGMGMMGLGLQGPMFAMADTNRDGKVTLKEATDAALRRFDLADIDHDRQLAPGEMQAARGRWQAMRR